MYHDLSCPILNGNRANHIASNLQFGYALLVSVMGVLALCVGNTNGRELGALGDGSVGFTQPERTTSGNLDAYGTPWTAVLISPADAADDDSQTIIQTDRRNRFTSFVRATDVPAGAGMLGSTTPYSSVEPRYDAAGNCTFDGHYFYQYDAWNRLIQVNGATQGQLFPEEGAAAMVMAGAGINPSPPVPGALVKHFTYDALGRLIRTQSPWPSVAGGTVRSEHFYYDGIRRIQEIVVDPIRVIDFEGIEGSGNAPQEMRALAQQHGGDGSAVSIAGEGESPTNVDGTASTTSFESAQASVIGTSVGGIESSNASLSREYIWGPGSSFVGAPVDELLVQIDGSGRTAWTMQDAGGDVVAVAVNTTGSGAGASAATGNAASATGTDKSFRVAAQMEYGPYGEVVWAEHLLNHPALHAGHKGLFIDRLDVGVEDNSAGVTASEKTFGEPPRVVPLAFNLAQNRNRTLHISMQRYLQLDPNASGANILGETKLGTASSVGIETLDIKSAYANGPNVYAYQSHNPSTRSDAVGLFDEDLDGGIDLALNLIPNPLLETYARTGVMAMRMGRDLTQGYSDNLSADVEWATDWSLSDDMHSRNDNTWVKDITRSHTQGFLDNNDLFGPAYASVASSSGRGASRVSQMWSDGPGRWFTANHHMSDEAKAYQARITKKPGIEYQVGDVVFDGYSKGGAFIEAKANYAHLMKEKFWNGIMAGFEGQARRQLAAIESTVGSSGRLVWHFKEPEVCAAVKKYFKDNNIKIIVVHSE